MGAHIDGAMTWARSGGIFLLVMVLGGLHYFGADHDVALHLFHRELFFVPILLGAFWFGLRGGVGVAVLAGLVYVPRLFHSGAHFTPATLVFQAMVFIGMGALMGWLFERERRTREEAQRAAGQAATGRAATAVGGEMSSILQSLREIAEAKPDADLSKDEDYKAAMHKLATLVEMLTAYAPVDPVAVEEGLGTDLNGLIRQELRTCRRMAHDAQVELQLDLDTKGCPSCVDTEHIGALVRGLVENAIEASGPGQAVEIVTRRRGETCEVQVRDKGVGMDAEQLHKLFKPFFTTKPHGYGMTLAAGRKVVRTLGGDLTAASTPGEGTTFTLMLPREATCEG